MMIPLLAIAGPTAVGKTALSQQVALKLHGEIVSADSMQVYRHLDIGTAKPTPKEREQVPHHLVDTLDPAVNYNVSLFQKDGHAAIKDITSRGKLPILVGGTGLYFNAVVYGYTFSTMEEAPKFRALLADEAKTMGSKTLYRRLQHLDPESASRIHPNDTRRIIRALEVLSLTGKPIAQQVEATQNSRIKYQRLLIGINRPREDLYRRIDERVEQMMAEGLLKEVENLMAMGYSPRLKALQSLGYRHMLMYLRGEASLEEAVDLLKRDTRRFAKRQLTWFKKNQGMIWITLENDTTRELDRAVKKICSLAAGEFFPGLE